MLTRAGMLRRVFVWRVVAATRPTAHLARPQVDPLGATLDAVLAFATLGCLTVATARICAHVVSGIVFLLFSQYLMDEGDRNRSFTHRRRHALDVAGADVTDGKHSG